MNSALDELLLQMEALMLGESPEAFAERIGLSGRSLRHALGGRNRPGAKMLAKLMQAYPGLWRYIKAYLEERNGE